VATPNGKAAVYGSRLRIVQVNEWERVEIVEPNVVVSGDVQCVAVVDGWQVGCVGNFVEREPWLAGAIQADEAGLRDVHESISSCTVLPFTFRSIRWALTWVVTVCMDCLLTGGSKTRVAIPKCVGHVLLAPLHQPQFACLRLID
jgi:hypothetical protein